MKKQNLVSWLKSIFFLVIIILLVVCYPEINNYYSNAEKIIADANEYGPLIYMVLMIFAILISPIPASPLAIISGSLFGVWNGLLYTLISATIGAVIAFTLARFFLRDWIDKKFSRTRFYKELVTKNNKDIAYLVFFTRLVPHISFDVVSYLAGITNINIFIFALVTFLGMIPIVFIEIFFGSFLKQYLIFIIIIILFVTLIYYLKEVITKKIV